MSSWFVFECEYNWNINVWCELYHNVTDFLNFVLFYYNICVPGCSSTILVRSMEIQEDQVVHITRKFSILADDGP